MRSLHVFVQANADRLFAGFALFGSLLIMKAGNYADNNGDASNLYLTASGMLEVLGQLYQLARGEKSKPISAPLYILGGIALFASGVGFLGLSRGSLEESITGMLMMAGAASIFYGEPLFRNSRFSGPFVGGWLYNLACLPLLIAGLHHQNPYEAGAAVAFIASNLSIAAKRKQA